jgi:peptidoglycan/LPS O-acetylase OafA/YrhL
LAVRTRSSRPGSAWAALVAGAASVAALPVAVYLTRFSEAYELLHSGFAIPVAGVLGFAALQLARRARGRDVLRLDPRPDWPARAGRILGLLGLFLAASAIVSLAVYGILEYMGSD